MRKLRRWPTARVSRLCQRPGQATGHWARRRDARRLARSASPSKPGTTLGEQKDDMFNRIREVFKLARIVRYRRSLRRLCPPRRQLAARLVEVTRRQRRSGQGHRACTSRPKKPHGRRRKSNLDAGRQSDKEREILLPKPPAKKGKPENIIRQDDRRPDEAVFSPRRCCWSSRSSRTTSKTVGKVAEAAKMKIDALRALGTGQGVEAACHASSAWSNKHGRRKRRSGHRSLSAASC